MCRSIAFLAHLVCEVQMSGALCIRSGGANLAVQLANPMAVKYAPGSGRGLLAFA